MTIMHERLVLTAKDKPVMFAFLPGVSCSICAPGSMTESEVERFANDECPPPDIGRWKVIDKSTINLGSPTPNPCNQVEDRKHWFLLSEMFGNMWSGQK